MAELEACSDRYGRAAAVDWEQSYGGLGNKLLRNRADRVVCRSLDVQPSCTITLDLSISRMSEMETVHFLDWVYSKDFHDPCCHWRPYWCSRSRLQPEDKLVPVVYDAT